MEHGNWTLKFKFMSGQPCVFTEEEMMAAIRQVLAEDIDCERELDPRAFLRRSILDAGGVRRHRSYYFPILEKQDAIGPERSDDPVLFRSILMPSVADALNKLAARASRLSPLGAAIRLVAWIATLTSFILRPLLFVMGAIACLALAPLIFVLFGADRVWRIVGWLLGHVERRNPIRATIWRYRLDRFAYHWDRFLARFPARLVDGLYMPDFQWMATSKLQLAVVSPKRLHGFGPDR